MKWVNGGVILLAGLLVSCQEPSAPKATDTGLAPSLARSGSSTATPASRAEVLADRINARLAASGSTIRLDEAWFFSQGQGIDPFRRLRTGSKWTKNAVTYVLDASDYTTEVAPNLVDAALVSAFSSWNAIDNTNIKASRVADDGGNNDVLDAIVTDANGNCVDIVDVTSPAVIAYDPSTGNIDLQPYADNVFGGWLDPQYFADCLGSANIIGVTWTFSDIDRNHDGYRDRVYTEMYYNTRFHWTTTGSIYLDFSPDAKFDIESIVVHEAGHTFGLGHFGGPNTNEPFKLQPNGKVFDPEAVMNPFYLGGEKRNPLATDVAALRTMY